MQFPVVAKEAPIGPHFTKVYALSKREDKAKKTLQDVLEIGY